MLCKKMCNNDLNMQVFLSQVCDTLVSLKNQVIVSEHFMELWSDMVNRLICLSIVAKME